MIVVVVASVVITTAILLSGASIGSFDLSRRVISNPTEGTETKVVENPAPPEHPAFPSPTANNFSSSAGANNNNNSFTERTLAKAPGAAIILLVLPIDKGRI